MYWTLNQVIAYNLKKAREAKGWTQKEAAKKLVPYLGKTWTDAAWSAAEASVKGERIRKFDADEILAIARTFRLPLHFFFLPPDPDEVLGLEGFNPTEDADAFYVWHLLGSVITGLAHPDIKERVEKVIADLPEEYAEGLAESYRVITSLDELNKITSQVQKLMRNLEEQARDIRKAQRLLRQTDKEGEEE